MWLGRWSGLALSSHMLPKVAIALWGVTFFGVGGFLLLCDSQDGQPVVDDDPREAIEVEHDEKKVLRRVMQDNLVRLQGLFEACARDDVVAAAALARSAVAAPGVGGAAPALKPDLPEQWLAWGKTIKQEYARFANLVDVGAASCGDLPQTLAVVTGSCISCHATYRVVVVPGP